MPVLLPYDGSAVARAALCHLTDARHRRWMDGRLILMLPAGQRCAVSQRLAEGRSLAGRDIAVSYRLIANDIPGALLRLSQSVAGAMFVSPLDLSGTTAWFQEIAHALLTGKYGPCMAVCELPRPAVTPDHPVRVCYDRPAPHRWRTCALWSSRSVADSRNTSRLEEL
jgi:hypothetical protein